MDTLTLEQALSVLPDGEYIHTFRGGGTMMLGANWPRKAITEALEGADAIMLTGPVARSMKHGMCIDDCGMLAIATDADKLDTIDPPEIK
jgi:hypothetical protein